MHQPKLQDAAAWFAGEAADGFTIDNRGYSNAEMLRFVRLCVGVGAAVYVDMKSLWPGARTGTHNARTLYVELPGSAEEEAIVWKAFGRSQFSIDPKYHSLEQLPNGKKYIFVGYAS